MSATLTATSLFGSRNQARKMLASIDDDLRGVSVTIDCSALELETPSFIDEVVRIVLVDREAAELRIQSAPSATAQFAMDSAHTLGVSDRVVVSS